MSKIFNFKTAENGRGELYLYGDIGFFGTDSVDFQASLDAMGDQDFDMYINSDGGSVTDGIAIYSMLNRYKGKITAHVDGIAASIASVILMAVDEVVMPENTMLMVHKPMFPAVYANEDELRDMADTLSRVEQSIRISYEGRVKDDSPMSVDELLNGKDHYLTADMAAQVFGNITVTEPLAAAAHRFDPEKTKLKGIPEGILNQIKTKTPISQVSDSATKELEPKPKSNMEKEETEKLVARVESLEAENKRVAEEAATNALNAERERVSAIKKAAAQCKGKIDLSAQALEAIDSGKSVEDFKDVVINELSGLPTSDAQVPGTEGSEPSKLEQLEAKLESAIARGDNKAAGTLTREILELEKASK